MVRVNVTDAQPTVPPSIKEEEIRSEMEQSPVEEASPRDQAGPVPLEELDKEALLSRAKELQAASDRHFDLYLRSQAEMENMRKRFQREKGEWAKFANESLIKDLLPVVDSLEKALAHVQEGSASEGLAEGVQLTLKGLKDVLSRAGMEEVKALGEKFDPHFHQAISQQQDERAEDGTVLIEVQKGYLLNGRLIRPSMVVVSKRN